MSIQIKIEDETLRRMRGFTHLATGEIGGMARVRQEGGGFYVWDLKLLPNQKVSGAAVNLDNEHLALFLGDTENADEFKFLWHSHVNMGASPSSTDEACIKMFIETSPYLISCITNKRGDCWLQFDVMVFGIRLSQDGKMATNSRIEFNDLRDEMDAHIVKEAPRETMRWNRDGDVVDLPNKSGMDVLGRPVQVQESTHGKIYREFMTGRNKSHDSERQVGIENYWGYDKR